MPTSRASDSEPARPRGWSRRECLGGLTGLSTCLALSSLAPSPVLAATTGRRGGGRSTEGLTPARYWQPLAGGRTECQLCPNRCRRSPGEDGRCRARGNRGGRYYSLVYGRPCVLAVDAIEKCPLYHFQLGPDGDGSNRVLSIATPGCNLSCSYCQNWVFSQAGPEEVPKIFQLSPQEVVGKALEHRAGAIAFFYTEPTVYLEYLVDIAHEARRHRLKTVAVTAGYLNPAPLQELLTVIDAVVLGLKGWSEELYRRHIGGRLQPVRETVRTLAAHPQVWWEVVNLVVPSLNDDIGNIAAMAAWLRDVAGPDRPLHFTRFRPEYRLKRLPMTPTATLTAARDTAMAQGLRHVYVGNLPGHEGAHTFCPACGQAIIERLAFTVLQRRMHHGRCAACGHQIPGVWNQGVRT